MRRDAIWGKAKRRGGTFRSLRVRNFRLFFVGHTVSIIGTWMQRVTQDLLILQLSESAFALGVSMTLQFGPTFLLGMWGGAVADRYDRRRVLVATQLALLVLSLALGILVVTNTVRLWMVYVFTLLVGVTTAVDNPTRYAVVIDLVKPDEYVNAQGLVATAQSSGLLIGPAVGGVVISAVGLGPVFLLNAASYLAVLGAVLRMDWSTTRSRATIPRHGGVRDAFGYIWRQPQLRAALGLVLAFALLAQNLRITLPLLATQTFHGGPQAYGYLAALAGLGALLGGLAAARRSTLRSRAVLGAAAAVSAASLAVAASPTLATAYLAVVTVGIANQSFQTVTRAVLLLTAEQAMSGRMMAAHSTAVFGAIPPGGLLMGWICHAWGVRTGLAVAGLSVLFAAVAAAPTLLKSGSSTTPDPSHAAP
ncbi:MAG: MFS transporter [Carbonactinosporaceae bacterium]